jgi:hypothetical protein
MFAELMLRTIGKLAEKAMFKQKPKKRAHMCCWSIWRIIADPTIEMERLAARK